MQLTKTDRAKYPFLPQAATDVRKLDLIIEDLTEAPKVLKHAEQRITASFNTTLQPTQPIKNPETETASFPVAIMMVAAINDDYLKKRYALHEAKNIHKHLEQEKLEIILEIAKFFKWNIEIDPPTKTKPYKSLKIPFTTYLQNTTNLQDPHWKLINRQLHKGKIHLTQHETTRLLQEEIRKHIETRLDTKVTTPLPPQIKTTVEKLKNTFIAQKKAIKQEEYPQTVNIEAFPPCIKALYDATASGHHLSHTGRFTLTTFLVNVGMPPENVLDLFRNLSDFNERLTRYQIEHIAGQRGSRTKYIPPRCSTLRTHGVCANPDEDCKKIRHPLTCYKRKLRQKSKLAK